MICNQVNCCAYEFSEWSDCSVSCGDTVGVKKRESICYCLGNQEYNTTKCPGQSTIETISCKPEFKCPHNASYWVREPQEWPVSLHTTLRCNGTKGKEFWDILTEKLTGLEWDQLAVQYVSTVLSIESGSFINEAVTYILEKAEIILSHCNELSSQEKEDARKIKIFLKNYVNGKISSTITSESALQSIGETEELQTDTQKTDGMLFAIEKKEDVDNNWKQFFLIVPIVTAIVLIVSVLGTILVMKHLYLRRLRDKVNQEESEPDASADVMELEELHL